MIVTAICPKKNIIGLHNARVVWVRRRPPQEISVLRRCRDCDIEFKFVQLWSSLGLLASDRITCAKMTCSKPTWQNTKLCESHILEVSFSSHRKSPAYAVAQTFLQKIKCSRWKTLPAKPNPKLEEVLDIFGLILAGELRPETVIFL